VDVTSNFAPENFRRRRGRPVGSQSNSECCTDRAAVWRSTPCLCDCHYPRIPARDLLQAPWMWD